ncbi:MAG: hypothetical protein ACRETL_00640 [Gammaproteobacteria bacterium]
MSKPTGSLRYETQRHDANHHHAVEAANEKLAQLPPERASRGSLKRPYERSVLTELGRWLARSLALLAIASCIALVAVGATPFLTAWSKEIARWTARGWAVMKVVPLSAIPLLLAGASYIVLQTILRQPPVELLKRVMLGSAFLLWGVTQLMPVGALSAELGNVVIALYVIDLGLMIRTDLDKDVMARS